MSRFFVATNVVNLYSEPDTSSEVVSQSTLGDIVEIEKTQEGFCWIATQDRYHGWVAGGHLLPHWDQTDYLRTSIATLFAEVSSSPTPQSEMLTKLVVGSSVALAHGAAIDEYIPIILPDKRTGYVHRVCLNITHDSNSANSDLVDPKVRQGLDIAELKRRVLEAVGAQAIQIGFRLIGTPYLWGGCTPFGIDCSGFVQLSYRLSGIQLLRDAELQFHDRRFVRCDDGATMEESDLIPGDLLAFQKLGKDKVTHIGMAIGDDRFIHSAGGRGVAVEWCAAEKYQATFAGAVRLSPDADLTVEAA